MTDDIQKILEEKLEDIVAQKVVEHFREDSFKVIIGQLTESVVTKTIKQRLLHVDLNQMVLQATETEIKGKIQDLKFPEGSIPFSAIKNNEIAISNSQITGGVQKRFKSKGIEDYATDCKLTVMDDNVVIENTLVALNATIKENLEVDGDLVVRGTVPSNSAFFKDIVEGVVERLGDSFEKVFRQSIVDGVLHTVKSQGLDVNTFTVGGKSVIENNSIANNITGSNLQKVGYLKNLQVKGEALIHDSLYVGNGRIGINTVEPSNALSVWDEETEVVIKKKQKHTAFIGSVRDTIVTLGANNQESVKLLQDGYAQIDKLRIGSSRFSSAPTRPNTDAEKGHVVFNSHPNLGRPVGWICLGGNRWSEFGKCE